MIRADQTLIDGGTNPLETGGKRSSGCVAAMQASSKTAPKIRSRRAIWVGRKLWVCW